MSCARALYGIFAARTVAAHLAGGLQHLLDLRLLKYSRVHRSRLDCLRGGVAGEGPLDHQKQTVERT